METGKQWRSPDELKAMIKSFSLADYVRADANRASYSKEEAKIFDDEWGRRDKKEDDFFDSYRGLAAALAAKDALLKSFGADKFRSKESKPATGTPQKRGKKLTSEDEASAAREMVDGMLEALSHEEFINFWKSREKSSHEGLVKTDSLAGEILEKESFIYRSEQQRRWADPAYIQASKEVSLVEGRRFAAALSDDELIKRHADRERENAVGVQILNDEVARRVEANPMLADLLRSAEKAKEAKPKERSFPEALLEPVEPAPSTPVSSERTANPESEDDQRRIASETMNGIKGDPVMVSFMEGEKSEWRSEVERRFAAADMMDSFKGNPVLRAFLEEEKPNSEDPAARRAKAIEALNVLKEYPILRSYLWDAPDARGESPEGRAMATETMNRFKESPGMLAFMEGIGFPELAEGSVEAPDQAERRARATEAAQLLAETAPSFAEFVERMERGDSFPEFAKVEVVPVPDYMREAVEVMGGRRVIGPEKIAETFGLDVEAMEIPPVPFSRAELERARELGQYLIFRTSRAADGSALTMKKMQEDVSRKLQAKGKEFYFIDGAPDLSEPFFVDDVSSDGWALVSEKFIPNSENRNGIQQTEALIQYVRESVFGESEIPKQYLDAIAQFNSRKDEIARELSSNRERAAKMLEELDITKLVRPSPVEAAYDALVVFDNLAGDPERPRRHFLTSGCTKDGGLLAISNAYIDFGDEAIYVERIRPADKFPGFGAVFARKSV